MDCLCCSWGYTLPLHWAPHYIPHVENTPCNYMDLYTERKKLSINNDVTDAVPIYHTYYVCPSTLTGYCMYMALSLTTHIFTLLLTAETILIAPTASIDKLLTLSTSGVVTPGGEIRKTEPRNNRVLTLTS